MFSDLISTRESLRLAQSSAPAEIEKAITRAQAPACAHAFIQTTFDAARATAGDPAQAARPLAGLAVSVKDLFDVAGQVTAAGSRVLADAVPAAADCAAVARLQKAGGAVLGRTHMVEFAFSGVGTNPHYPSPANVADPHLPRIPGGSSSGAAVSVASGAAFIGLGSDTGGSIRIPAALQGIVGFKSTARLVPATGTVPLSTTLDTVCALTRSVRDAVLAHGVLAARSVVRSTAPLSAYRFAVPQTTFLDALEPAVARCFDRALQCLRDAGATVVELPLPAVQDLGAIQSAGGFAAAESYAWHRHLLRDKGDGYDPRVRSRIARGADMKAHEYIELLTARQQWITRVEQALQGFDAALSPTVPIVAPTLASVDPHDANCDAEFFRVNALLLRNTSVINMLDGCGISIPCQESGALPVGLMVWQGALHDDIVLNSALLAEAALARR
jgi:aspartyl-tRNA(Asn)/glutamyl-tRNA(Gln) amidotransferase subunit A